MQFGLYIENSLVVQKHLNNVTNDDVIMFTAANHVNNVTNDEVSMFTSVHHINTIDEHDARNVRYHRE